MKRSTRIVLGFVCAVLAVAGLIIWETWRHVGEGLRRHQARLASDIASLRDRHAQARARFLKHETFRRAITLLLADDGTPGREEMELRCLAFAPAIVDYRPRLKLNEKGEFYPYEQGLAVSVGATSLKPGRMEPEQILEVLASLQEVARADGLYFSLERVISEQKALLILRKQLADQRYPVMVLEKLAEGLAHLVSTRPSGADALDAEHALYRASWLSFLKDPAMAARHEPARPGWQSFYSSRILYLGKLNQAEEHFDAMRSPHLRHWAERGVEMVKEVTDSGPYGKAVELYFHDGETRGMWGAARVAAAAAIYREKKGHWPAGIQDIVPDFLPSVPACPRHAVVLSIEGGAVCCTDVNKRCEKLLWPMFGR